MLGVYRDFMEGVDGHAGRHGPEDRLGAIRRALAHVLVRALMQDNKALQAGTSHNLGQNFAKAFELSFQTETGVTGVRVEHELGRLHAHDRWPGHDARRRRGLVTPPLLAPTELVIVPSTGRTRNVRRCSRRPVGSNGSSANGNAGA
jgi:prolyl-tRNA synthetase